MKLRVLCATLAFGVLGMMTMAPVHAQSVDPCTVYTCMAGISGSGASGGPGCTAATDYFFGVLVVFDPYFDAPDTAQVRRNYLATCPGSNFESNAAILNSILTTWYAVP